MDEELLNQEEEITSTPSEEITPEEPVIPEEVISDEPTYGHGYAYPIYDQSNNLITEPNLELGYLKKEYFTVHHSSVPEQWHYQVTTFDFADGSNYKPASNADPHVKVIDDQKGIFEYVQVEGEEQKTVVGQTITPVLDSPMVEAWDETRTIFRYVEYTEKELSDRDFLTNGPALLAEAQETIDDLLLVIADLLGGAEE